MVDVITLGLDVFHGCFKQRSVLRGYRNTITPIHSMVGEVILLGDPLSVWYTSLPVTVTPMPKFPTVSTVSSQIVEELRPSSYLSRSQTEFWH